MDYYRIKKCFNCRNRVVDLDELADTLEQVMEQTDFNARQGTRVDLNRPLHHQVFHVALAGCPNSCSQPQIKDFGVQGQARPVLGEGCIKCGLCAEMCPEKAISTGNEGALVERHTCLNCGICARVCSTGAMRVEKTGYRVLIGGKLGRRPRLATEMLAMANKEEVAAALHRCVELFLIEARPGERFGSLVERVQLSGEKE